MVSVIKSAILILSVFSSLSFSFGHRFLLQEQEHPNHDLEDMELPLKGAVTLGDHVASEIGGGKIPEIHSLCQTCNCGGGGGGGSDDSSSGSPLSDIPLIGEIIPEITGILGIPFPEKSQARVVPNTDGKNLEPLPPIPEVERQDTIGIHN